MSWIVSDIISCENQIHQFFLNQKIGSLLKRSNIDKEKGIFPVAVFRVLFTLVFTGKYLYRALEAGGSCGMAKDTVYRFLNSVHANWRRFLLLLSSRVIREELEPLTGAANIVEMAAEAVASGIQASHLLFDSWFAFPATMKKLLAKGMHTLCMLKVTEKIFYRYQGEDLHLAAIYRKIRKRRDRAKILASIMVEIGKNDQGVPVPAKIVFVRDRRTKKWLLLLSADTPLDDEQIIMAYKRRWDIGVSREGRIIQSVKVRPRLIDSRPRSLEGAVARKQDGEALRQHSLKGRCATHQVATYSERRRSLVTRTPVAETVDNARRQQEG